MKKNAPQGTRRELGRRAVLGSVGLMAGTAAGAGQKLVADERPDASADAGDQRKLSYRETDHVRWYYRRARM